jgi:chromosome segregation ATPase
MEESQRELANECQKLKSKLRTYEEKHLKAKHVIFDKHSEIEALKREMEKCSIERERVQLEFDNYVQSTRDVGQLMEMVAENASLKSNLEISKKMCISLQEKTKSDGLNHAKEIEALKEKLRLENSSAKSLMAEIENYLNKLNKMDQALKKLSNDNQQIMNENCDKNEKIKALEVIINADSLKLLQMLFAELNICTTDLDSLVNICNDIYKRKDINVHQLIGSNSSNAINFIDLNDASLINNLINRDYLIKKSDELKSLRKQLNEIRKFISDEYAERLGNDMSCIQQ